MRITDLYIDGFGKFNDFPINDFSNGLTVLHGKNEAGKSTLLSFIRRMFFDFPRNNSNCNHYLPFNGGSHGGRLSIVGDDGNNYTIERHNKKTGLKVHFSDGTIKSENELRAILGNADKDVFENVYAFGLDELQDFNKLNGDSVSGKLYSAGTGIGAVSIPGISSFLDSKKGELYKPTGKKPAMNVLFNEIKNLEHQIAEIEDGQFTYDLLHGDIRDKEKDIADLKKERSFLLQKQEHVKSLLSIWDDWVDLQIHSSKLQELPVIDSFPENGLNRYDNIKEKILDIDENIEELKSDIEVNKTEQSNIVLDEPLLAQENSISELVKGIEKYRAERVELPNLRLSLKSEKKKFDSMLQELGPDWNEEKLNGFDRSIPAIDTVRKRHGELQEVDGEIKKLRQNIEMVEASISKKDQNQENVSGILLEQRTSILKLADKVTSYRNDLEKIKFDNIKLDSRNGELTQVLNEIGNDWDESILESFDLSNSMRDHITLMISNLNDTEFNIHDLETQLGWMKSEVERIDQNISDIDSKMNVIDVQIPENKNHEMLAALKSLKGRYPSLKEKEMELKSLERDENFASLIKQTPAIGNQRMPIWPAGAFAVVGIAAFGVGYVYDNLQGGVIACVGLFIIAIIYAISVKNSGKDAQLPVNNTNVDFSGNNKRQIEEDIRSFKEKMLKDSNLCGFDDIPEMSVLEDKYDELKEYALGLKTFSDISLQKQNLEKEWEVANENHTQLEAKLNEMRSAYQKAQKEWKDWLVSCSLDSDIKPENIHDKLAHIKEGKDKQTVVKELESQILLYEKSIKEFEDDARNLLETCDYDISELSLDMAIIELRNDVDIEYAKTGKVEQLTQDREDLERDYETLSDNLKEREEERTNILEKWHEWLSKYDISPEITTESIIDMFTTIKSCYEVQNKIKELDEKIELYGTSIDSYEDGIKSIFDACGKDDSGLDLDTELEILYDDMEKEVSKNNKLESLTSDMNRLLSSLKEAENKLSGLTENMNVLLKEGNSETESEFVKNAKIWDEIVQAKQGYEVAESHIRKLSGNDDEHLMVMDELNNSKLELLKAQVAEMTEKINDIEDGLDALNDEKGSIKNQIAALEGYNEGSELRLEHGALIEELNEKSREWATYSVAQHILSKAMDRYEKERQPAVITEAQTFFSNITGGKYERIYSPLGSSDIYVEDVIGKRKNITELSRGTAEQLYLALRFGFIKELGKHSESLPIIFDDILVNFDPVRSRNAISSINELSMSNQVLYFTCHPGTVEMFRSIVPEVSVIELDG